MSCNVTKVYLNNAYVMDKIDEKEENAVSDIRQSPLSVQQQAIRVSAIHSAFANFKAQMRFLNLDHYENQDAMTGFLIRLDDKLQSLIKNVGSEQVRNFAKINTAHAQSIALENRISSTNVDFSKIGMEHVAAVAVGSTDVKKTPQAREAAQKPQERVPSKQHAVTQPQETIKETVYQFPDESSLLSCLERQEALKDPYFTEKGIHKAVAQQFADQKKTQGGLCLGVEDVLEEKMISPKGTYTNGSYPYSHMEELNYVHGLSLLYTFSLKNCAKANQEDSDKKK